MTFSFVLNIAEQVEEDWLRGGRSIEIFPEIAARALTMLPPISFRSIVRDLFADGELPLQRRLDEGFGQPGLTLYHSDRFDIEALCWRDGTPAIHEHGFAGAFRLLEGSSVQARFRFQADRQLGSLELGNLLRCGFERLESGAITQIDLGENMIHSNFHLEDPGLTLVVRTHQQGNRERTFLPTGIAFDSAKRSSTLQKRLQMLDTLNAIKSADYAPIQSGMIARGAPDEVLALLLRSCAHASAQIHFDGFLHQVRQRFGSLDGDLLSAAIANERRRSITTRLRRTVSDPDTRLVLACLLDSANRADFDALVSSVARKDFEPSELILVLARLLQPAEPGRALAIATITALLAGDLPHEFVARTLAAGSIVSDDVTRSDLEQYFLSVRNLVWLAPLLSH